MIKYNTGDILPFKFFTTTNQKGGDYHDLLAEGHWVIEQLFHKNRDITETWVADIAGANAMMFKIHPELRDTIKLLRMFVFSTLDKPSEIADLPDYDKDFNSSLRSLYTVILEEREQFQELLSELKSCERELSAIDDTNIPFEEKYPELAGLEKLQYKFIPEEFHGMKSINQMRKAVLKQIEEYGRLEDELESLND